MRKIRRMVDSIVNFSKHGHRTLCKINLHRCSLESNVTRYVKAVRLFSISISGMNRMNEERHMAIINIKGLGTSNISDCLQPKRNDGASVIPPTVSASNQLPCVRCQRIVRVWLFATGWPIGHGKCCCTDSHGTFSKLPLDEARCYRQKFFEL